MITILQIRKKIQYEKFRIRLRKRKKNKGNEKEKLVMFKGAKLLLGVVQKTSNQNSHNLKYMYI